MGLENRLEIYYLRINDDDVVLAKTLCISITR